MIDEIAGWNLEILFAELCRENKKIAIMELLMRVCVEPAPNWMDDGVAIVRTFGTHLFVDDKFTDDDYHFLP